MFDKVISTLKFLVPWSNKTVNVITEMDTNLVMPLYYSAQLDRRSSAFNMLQLNATSIQSKVSRTWIMNSLIDFITFFLFCLCILDLHLLIFQKILEF